MFLHKRVYRIIPTAGITKEPRVPERNCPKMLQIAINTYQMVVLLLLVFIAATPNTKAAVDISVPNVAASDRNEK